MLATPKATKERDLPECQLDLGLGHRYKLGPLLAHATCGDVWQATWVQTGEKVTVKTLHTGLTDSDFELFASILTEEAEHHRHLSHPHIVRFQRSGRWQGRPVLVMEQLDQSLTEWLKAQTKQNGVVVVPAEQAMAWAQQLAGALAALHRSGRKHLDLKPANVLLTRPNAKGVRAAKLADFGACLPVDCVRHRWAGTPEWAAPEQAQTVGTDAQGFALYATSVASDWYALGQLLHRLLYGRVHALVQETKNLGAVDDSPTWRRSECRPHQSRTVTIHDANRAVPVDLLLRQLLSHEPQERLLAAERWLNRTGLGPKALSPQ